MMLPNIVKNKKNSIKEMLRTNKKIKNRAIDLINIFNCSNTEDGDDCWYTFFLDEGNFEDMDAGQLACKLLEHGCVSSEELVTILDKECDAFWDLEQRMEE